MTTQEFSDAFDTLLASYSSKASFGEEAPRGSLVFDEYEKSLFLTSAQEEIVEGLYSGKNTLGAAFEGSEELRRYLANLVVEKRLQPITNTNGTPLGLNTTSQFFTLPDEPEVWFITYEAVTVSHDKCKDNSTMRVYPVKQDEYQNLKNNPFRGANDRRALRLDLSEGNVEIVCKYPVTDYYIRYLKKLSPIILVDLPEELSIDGKTKAAGCELHEGLHRRILERAVMKALQSKGYSTEK